MAELLLELLSEEIPARMQARAAEDLKRLVTEKLAAARLTFSRADAHVTPRRLALVVDGLPTRQPDLSEERKGPRVGAPEQAIEGFLKSAALASLDECEKRMIGDAEFYFAVRALPGLDTDRVLPEVLDDAIRAMTWPKSMRWRRTEFKWIRPLHNILAMFEGRVVGLGFDLVKSPEAVVSPTPETTLSANNRTRGHRFLAPKPFEVRSFADYREKLRAAYVILDRDERKEAIRKQAAALAAAEGLVVADDPALLEEVAGLVEWPAPLVGSIDARFMALPREVLTTTMRTNQKYFALETRDGVLAPRFILVSNMPAEPEVPEAERRRAALRSGAIVAGNERVLRARLSDAQFFWDQDRKTKLASRVPRLDGLIFHAKLGSVGEKARRLQALTAGLVPRVPGADLRRVQRAAILCKADLVSGMVGEFPELQGIMGSYYARLDGEDPAVAQAIAEHYAPLGPDDRCPTAPISIVVALADKIDTLVGFFTIGEKPTGSRDPFALRRTALGVIRIIVENELRIPLGYMFGEALLHYFNQGNKAIRDAFAQKGPTAGAGLPAPSSASRREPGAMPVGGPVRREAVRILEVPGMNDLLAFFAERLKVHLREKGVRHDLVSAVFAQGGEDDLVRLLARVKALADFLASEDGADLLTAYKRASNIVRIEEKKDGRPYNGAADPRRLEQAEEKALHAGLGRAVEEISAAVRRDDFSAAMAALARLRRPVDAFFDKVTVNCDDKELRENRLRLLSAIRSALGGVADFSKIEG